MRVVEPSSGRSSIKYLPNSLLKSVGDLIATICPLQNAYGTPCIKFTLKDKILAEKILRLRDGTN